MRVIAIVSAVAMLLIGAGLVRSTRSAGYTEPDPHERTTIVPLANRYLEHHLGPVDFPGLNGGRWFCRSNLLGTTHVGSHMDAYLWISCDEVAPTAAGGLKYGTGISPPIVLHLDRRDGQLVPTSYDQPGDGSLCVADVNRMFPGSLASYVLSNPDFAGPLEAAVRTDAKRAFSR